MKKLIRLKRYIATFGAVVVLCVFAGSFSIFASETQIEADLVLDKAPSEGVAYGCYSDFFDYYVRYNSTQVSSNYLYSQTFDPNTDNLNHFRKTSLLQVYTYDDGFLFWEDYYYSIEFLFRIRCDDSSGTASSYDPSQTVFFIFNDQTIWDESTISEATMLDNSASFLPSSVETVGDLYYKLTYNIYIDPESDLAKANRVNYSAIGGYDHFGYLFYSIGFVTPNMNLRFCADTNLTSPVTYTIHCRTDLMSGSAQSFTSEEYWLNYIDGKVGELSETIEEQTDRIISGEELPDMDISDIRNHYEQEFSTFDDWISRAYQSPDAIFSYVDVAALIPTMAAISNWYQYVFETNAFIYITVSIIFAFLIIFAVLRILF